MLIDTIKKENLLALKNHDDALRAVYSILISKYNLEGYEAKANGKEIADPEMIKILDKWQQDITDGIVGLANLFDPDCVVLSGSMAEFTDTEKIEQNVNSQIVTTPTKVKKAQAGNYAGMIGTALLALNQKVGQYWENQKPEY